MNPSSPSSGPPFSVGMVVANDRTASLGPSTRVAGVCSCQSKNIFFED